MHTDDFTFHHSASFRHPQRIYNIVPHDYTHDGKLDMLVMVLGTSTRQLSLSIYPSMPGFCELLRPCLALLLKYQIDMNPIGLLPSMLA
jgi:hypothetical protein